MVQLLILSNLVNLTFCSFNVVPIDLFHAFMGTVSPSTSMQNTVIIKHHYVAITHVTKQVVNSEYVLPKVFI